MAKKLVKAETKAENTEVKVDVRKELREVEDKLMDFIPESEKGTDRADCLDRITYALDDKNKTDEELSVLLEEGRKFLAVETEKKKEKKKSIKKTVKAEEPSEEVEEPKPKKAKKERFEFPEELKHEDETYVMAEIEKVTDVEVGDLIACEWTEQQLKDFEYDTTGVLGQPKKFEQDLDVLVAVNLVEDKLVWGQSIGTGLMFYFRNKDIKKMVAEGMPFRVYKLAK